MTSVMSDGVRLMISSPFHLRAVSRGLFLTRFKFDTVLPSHPAAHFCLLDKLFGKRLVQARHYIMSRKSWLKMVPTENCDILMTFPGTISSSVLWWISPSSRVLGGQPATQDLTYSLGTAKCHPFMHPGFSIFSGSYTRGKRFISSHQIGSLTQRDELHRHITCVHYLMSHANMNCEWASSSGRDRNSLWCTLHKTATGFMALFRKIRITKTLYQEVI